MLQRVGLCVTDRWEQWGGQRWEGVLEDWAQGSLGHPHTWPDAAAGVWRLLLHARYQISSIQTRTHTHVNTQLTPARPHSPACLTSEGGPLLLPCVLVFLVLCPKWPIPAGCTLTLMLCSPLPAFRRNGAEVCVCVCVMCVCVCVRGDLAWTQSFKFPWNCVH